jgi:hypothetical protein
MLSTRWYPGLHPEIMKIAGMLHELTHNVERDKGSPLSLQEVFMEPTFRRVIDRKTEIG